MNNQKPGFNKTPIALIAGLCLSAPLGAAAMTIDWDLKTKISGLAEGARDLGTTPEGLGTPEIEDTTEGILEINPAVRLQIDPHHAIYTRLQGFLPTGRVTQFENDEPVRSEGFGALRELWWEYGGIGSYPGQYLRLGLQRVREADGLWWDRDIESLRWILDTTLVQAQFGVAQQFSTYRTDDVELPVSQEDRPYVFGGFSMQYTPGHYFGVRGAYAQDGGDLQALGETPNPEEKTAIRRLGWVGVRVESGYYDWENQSPLNYWAELTLNGGHRESSSVDPLTNVIVTHSERDVRALAADLGLRWRLAGPESGAPSLGLAYAWGQGDAEGKHRFEPTGLQSNRSRFTGTRSLIHRLNEAYQADQTNIHVASAYFSMSGERNDMSVVLSDFRRDDDQASVSTGGVDIQPLPGESALGQGVDLVLAHYFGAVGADEDYAYGDDARNNIRLRGSMFTPGSAYVDNADDQYRVMLEATLWF